ncbi:prepilin-type N-terminal cleavage/methylation domain-containing protein [Dyella solisilvae]|uniref:Type II secretion system protein H n=1 Tax=Dyella solisilvae TaxID=1920168 RepID=A0A370KBC0_9GAMM|nr:GspH/FimT family pseudopilin [Dyella solisilvae]RDI99747.1 prepilin-type N-terminal cleavage/methylation domain-containing protein [Dyella solisilvae]
MASLSSGAQGRGVTLIELLIAMSVLAVLAMLAAPAFHDTVGRHQLSAAADALAADLTYARMEAMQRATFVSLCPSRDGVRCSDDSSYGQGWMTYSYPVSGSGANREFAAADQTFRLLRYSRTSGALTVTAADGDIVTFGLQGQLKPSGERGGRSWRFCILSDTGHLGSGVSTSAIPGTEIAAIASGSLQRRRLAVDESCVPEVR